MKRSALQCVAGFVGATLIVVGVVWTCRQLSSPTQLNAAQDTQESGLAYFSRNQKETAKAPTPKTKKISSKAQEAKKIRPTSAVSDLRLAMLESEQTTQSLKLTPPITPSPLPPASDSFNASDAPLNNELPISFEGESVFQAPLEASSTGKLNLVSDEDQSVALSFHDLPEAPSALPLESEGDLLGSAPISPSHDQANASSLSLQEIENDFPQTAQPEGFPAPPFEEDVLDVSLSSENQLEDATLQQSEQSPREPPHHIPRINSEEQKTNELFAENNKKAISNYVNTVLSNQATPGDAELEGPQTTQIVVEKIAPEEVQTNKPAKIVIRVKNAGNKTARRLILHETLPQNAQFVSADNDVSPTAQGDLFWPMFDLESQREKKFEYTVVPSAEGFFGSVATVLLPIEASSKTKCSRPELKVEATAPESVELGENVNFDIVVTNIGTGTAYNVALLETIPEGLFHPNGSVLDNKLGVIKAGESKRLPLTLKTRAQGKSVNKLTVSADDCEQQEIETIVRVTAPLLELDISGVTNAYLEQSTRYKLSVKNVGDASARDVRLVAQLPESVTFVKANNLGAYKEDEHSVYWDLAELPAQTDGEIELTLKSTKPDNVELVFSASGPNNLTAQATKTISFDGLAALSFNVTSSVDLLEAGKELEYTITIVNNGTKASSNVILQILAPEAISILATDGPTQATNRSGVIVFDRISEIGAKSSTTYKVKASANQAGDCRVGFQLSSDDLDPLVKETNTRVYE